MSVEGVNVTIDDEKDRKSGFCTCRWALGFTLSLVAGILHVVVTPFVDIVVLSFNSATAIVIQVFMAIFLLNEVFICKFDLTALFLIILGSACLILTANFNDQEYSTEVLKKDLMTPKSICYFVLVFLIVNLTFYVLKNMKQSLAHFEKDVENWLDQMKDQKK